MSKFEIKSDKFFIYRFNDGILVSIMDTSNALSYARQIHSIVSRNLSKDFFASDLAEMIDCPEYQKEIILNTLFVYSEKGISISGANIHEIHDKNRMAIQHNGEVFLVIKRRKCYVSSILLLTIFAFIIVNVFDHVKSYSEPDSDNDTEQAEVDDSSYPLTVSDSSNQVSLPSSPDMTTELNKLNDDNIQEEAVKVDSIIETATVVKDSNQQCQSDVLSKVNNSKTTTIATPSGSKSTIEGTLTDESLVAEEFLRIADSAYNKYLMTLDENDGIRALYYYERTLESINYLPIKKEEIVERINTLKEVII